MCKDTRRESESCKYISDDMQQNILATSIKMCRGVLPMKKLMFLVGLISVLTFFTTTLSQSEENLDQESDDYRLVTYIVQVSKPDRENGSYSSSENLHAWYRSFLPRSDSGETTRHLLYTYRNVIHGFAVQMTEKELKVMEKKKGFVSARPERVLSLHTTHSPNFLGLMNRNFRLWRGSNFGKGIIVGVIDTGIRPEHPSFSDEGMPPPPAKWKGICEFNGLSKCNNKLIGARNLAYSSSETKIPPFDHVGHGTHTASTAAGNFVNHAGIFGNAEGVASGMAPYAHLAIYKACNHEGCHDSAILASMDAAIDDGVDILSMSLGSSSLPFFEDIMAVGGFAATMKGIVVSTSAGNAGPDHSTLSNEAPWLLTVGASTIDRSVRVTAKLGNGVVYNGESLFQPKDLNLTSLPLIYVASQNQSSVFCAPGSLVNAEAKGKVVLCERGGQVGRIQKGQEVKNAGGVAMILMNQEKDGFTILADPHVLPAAHVSYESGVQIKAYIESSLNPQATISFKGTVTGYKVAPAVASFSSRGPNTQSPGILKPDVIGPGVNILAAWTKSVENNNNNNSNSTFNMISGTSMSCPHLSGIAALLKSSHPDWSPAAIKSAIMTTADLNNLGYRPILDQKLEPADLLAVGAGHVHPSKANDPGLVYDLHPDDYIPYLCGLGYSKTSMAMILQRVVDCSKVQSIPEAQLNYPSFSILMGNASQHYTRTLTNVGPAHSTYSAEVHVPLAFGMIVKPTTIAFTEVNQKLSYSVEFIPGPKEKREHGEYAKGYLRWVSDSHTVTSPISVTFN